MKLYKKPLACNQLPFILMFFFFLIFWFVVLLVPNIMILLTPMFLCIIFADANISATIVQCAFDFSINCQLRNLLFNVIYHFKFVGVLMNVYTNLHNLLHFLGCSMLNAIFNIFQIINNIFQLHHIFAFFAYHNLLVR